jgi:predicted nucleic acid-binding protein
MKLVADSNVLFTYFWKDSVFRSLCHKLKLTLFSPEYALEEINQHAKEIMEKSGLLGKDFSLIKEKLVLTVNFIPLTEYSGSLTNASSLINGLQKDITDDLMKDIDFIALALKLNCPIWSNDKLLKRQSKVLVLSTKDIINLS